MLEYLIVLIIPMIISFIFTPFAKKIANSLGAIDKPDGYRRMHVEPTPRMGGLAIYIAVIIGVLIFEEKSTEIIGFLIASTIIVIMGMVDDTKALPAKLKFLVQVIVAIILYKFGIKIEILTDPIFSESGYIGFNWYISLPLTIIWIVGVTNTINLIDGLDGLSAGVSAIAAVSLGIVTMLDGNQVASVLAFILAGSALGFLPYNFKPASIFMGDTGSLFLGISLAVISIEGAVKAATTVAFIIPIIILGLPIFDTLFAMIRRAINRKPIMGADRGHIHHKLVDRGYSHLKTVLVLYSISIIFGFLAVKIYTSFDFKTGVMVVIVASVLVSIFFKKYLNNRQNIDKKK